jgi:hypothetical protein
MALYKRTGASYYTPIPALSPDRASTANASQACCYVPTWIRQARARSFQVPAGPEAAGGAGFIDLQPALAHGGHLTQQPQETLQLHTLLELRA